MVVRRMQVLGLAGGLLLASILVVVGLAAFVLPPGAFDRPEVEDDTAVAGTEDAGGDEEGEADTSTGADETATEDAPGETGTVDSAGEAGTEDTGDGAQDELEEDAGDGPATEPTVPTDDEPEADDDEAGTEG